MFWFYYDNGEVRYLSDDCYDTEEQAEAARPDVEAEIAYRYGYCEGTCLMLIEDEDIF